MSKLQMPILAVLFSLLFASLARAASLPEENPLRVRRATADQRIAELQALNALARNNTNSALAHNLDIDVIGKKKRDSPAPLPRQYSWLRLRGDKRAAAMENTV